MDEILANLRKGYLAGDPEAIMRYAAAMDRAFFGGGQEEKGDLEQKLERVQEYKAAFYAAMIALHENEHLRKYCKENHSLSIIVIHIHGAELNYSVEGFRADTQTYHVKQNRLVCDGFGLLFMFPTLTISQVREKINERLDQDPIYQQAKKELGDETGNHIPTTSV